MDTDEKSLSGLIRVHPWLKTSCPAPRRAGSGAGAPHTTPWASPPTRKLALEELGLDKAALKGYEASMRILELGMMAGRSEWETKSGDGALQPGEQSGQPDGAKARPKAGETERKADAIGSVRLNET